MSYTPHFEPCRQDRTQNIAMYLPRLCLRQERLSLSRLQLWLHLFKQTCRVWRRWLPFSLGLHPHMSVRDVTHGHSLLKTACLTSNVLSSLPLVTGHDPVIEARPNRPSSPSMKESTTPMAFSPSPPSTPTPTLGLEPSISFEENILSLLARRFYLSRLQTVGSFAD